MLEKYAQLRKRIYDHVEHNLEDLPQKAYILTQVDTFLAGRLRRVWAGLITSSSTLKTEAGEISPSALENLVALDSHGIYLFVIPDDSDCLAILQDEDLNNLIQPQATTDTSTHDIGKYFLESIRDHGLHFNKIGIIASLEHRMVSDTLKAIHETRLPVFCTDFQIEHLAHRTAEEDEDPSNKEPFSLPIVREDDTLLKGSEALEYLCNFLPFARRINVRETATLVVNGDGPKGILDKLEEVKDKATQNLTTHQGRLFEDYPHLKNPMIFDDRSGAVYFSPFHWRHLQDSLPSCLTSIYDYFNEKLPGYWQPGRPCYKRILFTPTKVLLRGEQYYTHMMNLSPIDRIFRILKELGVIQGLQHEFQEALASCNPSEASRHQWKLCLAYLDQFRNIAIQLFSFAHAAELILNQARNRNGVDQDSILRTLEQVSSVYGDAKSRLHSFVGKAIRSYYSWLLCNPTEAEKAFQRALNCLRTVHAPFREICNHLGTWFTEKRVDLEGISVSNLVRRWREADHPGENLLTIRQALEDLEDREEADSVHVIGVGWGGIELPFLFRYLAKERQAAAVRAGVLRCYVASWSHYRGDRKDISWVPFPEFTRKQPSFEGGLAIILDDNTLSGITLEKVRDEVLLNGAEQVEMYVTRFSGERRWAHMKMKNHGVIDPDFLLEGVKGYIGETPFARSWSTKEGEYKSRIGVFSLARRRILECIHNNSTVEMWDREGF